MLGWPVGHSRSPHIQNAALRAAGLHDWSYQLLPVPPHLFAETVRALPAAGFRGANVTIPHKEAALALADQASDRARAIGAANTLLFEDGAEVRADNTDAPALIDALPFSPSGRTALVLGAGGSARAAVWALLQAGAAEARVWNRTVERARKLAGELGAVAVTEALPAELLVNCTAAALDQLPVSKADVRSYDCVVDYVYGMQDTALITAARTHGIAAVDGLTLLVGQAALSFEQFTGLKASAEAMRAALKS